jgi:hypothetical protein
MKKFFEKLPEMIGMFLLRALLLLGALTCFGAGVYQSWEHTTALALSHGLSGGLATAYTILVEVLLCMCEIALIFLILLGKRTNLSIKVGLGFGLAINLTANVLSLWDYGFLGIAIGVSIPVGSAISAWVFASALVKEVEKVKISTSDNSTTQEIADSLDRSTVPDEDSPSKLEQIVWNEPEIIDTLPDQEPESDDSDTDPIDEPAPITTPQPIEPITLEETAISDTEPDESDTSVMESISEPVPTVTKVLTPVAEIKRRVSDNELKQIAEEMQQEIGDYPSIETLKPHGNSRYQAEKILKELRLSEKTKSAV